MEALILTAIEAALEAGRVIRTVYRRDFEVTTKADRSPLTEADRRSHDIILGCLAPTEIPVLSEEGREIPYAQRSRWERLWIVDPLDGTKEFIKRNGEFTVNIALVVEGHPVLGVVLAPEKNRLYFGGRGLGAYRGSPERVGQLFGEKGAPSTDDVRWRKLTMESEGLPVPDAKSRVYTIVGSRSHATPELEAFVESKRKAHRQVEFVAAGSSLKICRVAEGTADIYPRLGPTMEWDTAAGQGVVEAAGGRLIDYHSGEPLQYNRENLLNPWFYVLSPSGGGI